MSHPQPVPTARAPRIRRVLAQFVLTASFVAALSTFAAHSTLAAAAGIDDLARLVDVRLEDAKAQGKEARKARGAFTKSSRLLHKPTKSVAGDLGRIAKVAKFLDKAAASDAVLDADMLELVVELTADAVKLRSDLETWEGELGNTKREKKVAAAVDKFDVLLLDANGAASLAERAKALSKGCKQVEKTAKKFKLVGGFVPPDAKPDFSLSDVNPASTSSGRKVSPRDLQGAVSAWYFGHST